MDEEELRAFIEIVNQYFERQTGRLPELGNPYLGDPAALPMYEELARSYGLDLIVKHVTARRSIAAKSSSRGDVGEVMVSPRLP